MTHKGPFGSLWMDCPFFLLTAIPACSKSDRDESSHHDDKIGNATCRTNMKLAVVAINLLACSAIPFCSSRFVSFLEN